MKRKKKSLSTWKFSVRAASEGSTPKASDGDVTVILAPIYSLRSFHVTGMPKYLSTYALIEGRACAAMCIQNHSHLDLKQQIYPGPSCL